MEHRKAVREHFENEAHPINLNVGRIEGGDWASPVPCWCRLDCRTAIYHRTCGYHPVAPAPRWDESTMVALRAWLHELSVCAGSTGV
jgi:hypothetical protein